MGKLDYERYLDLLEDLDVSIDGKVTYRKNGRTVPTYLNKQGYLRGKVQMNGKVTNFNIHTLIAARWLPQPTSLDVQVSHLDEGRTNNQAANLQWVSAKQNSNMPLWKQRQSKAHNWRKRKVSQYDLNGKFLSEFESIAEAARVTNCSTGHISHCCQGKRNTADGYVWKWA